MNVGDFRRCFNLRTKLSLICYLPSRSTLEHGVWFVYYGDHCPSSQHGQVLSLPCQQSRTPKQADRIYMYTEGIRSPTHMLIMLFNCLSLLHWNFWLQMLHISTTRGKMKVLTWYRKHWVMNSRWLSPTAHLCFINFSGIQKLFLLVYCYQIKTVRKSIVNAHICQNLFITAISMRRGRAVRKPNHGSGWSYSPFMSP